MKNPDQLYYIPDVGLWGIGEETAGFLVIGIPSIPKVTSVILASNPVKSLLSTWRGTSSSPQGTENSASHERRQSSSRKRRGLWSTTGTEVDEEQLVTIKTSRTVHTSVRDISGQSEPYAVDITSSPNYR
jgi:hypothetical protein